MEKAATDIYTFENLRVRGFTYVDKTAILKELADLSRGSQFFIARPRRFGKSLAVSTLRCLFEGKHEYFEGLAIEREWDWSKKWPVIHLDMGTMQYDTVGELASALTSYLQGETKRLGVSIDGATTVPEMFRRLIVAAAEVSNLTVDDNDLDAYEPERIKPVTLLFQTGYLTIKGFKQMEAICLYTLGFPNLEVENSFLKDLSAVYVGQETSDTVNVAAKVVNALHSRDPEGFVEYFRQFFAAIPYDLTDRQNEQSWQAIMYAVLRVVGINVGGEVRTHKGRIDLTVETATDAYIIEVKRDSTAKKAIEQIQAKEYTDRFRLSGKSITLIGMSFSTKRRTISGVKIVKNA